MYTLVLSILFIFSQGNLLFQSTIPGFTSLESCTEASNKAEITSASIESLSQLRPLDAKSSAECVPEGKSI